jgi:translation initiation factor 4E
MPPRPGILNSALTPSSCGINKAKQHHTFLFSTVTPLGPRMSNYFSNHSSQSRFLAISSSSNAAHSTSSTSSSQSPGVAQPVGGQGPTAKRARSTSKHFSTSVEAHGEGRKGEEEEDGAPLPSVHPLRNTCVFCLVLNLAIDGFISLLIGFISVPFVQIFVVPFWGLVVHGYSWVFWFRQQRAPGNKIISYEEGIKRVAAFSSVRPQFYIFYT